MDGVAALAMGSVWVLTLGGSVAGGWTHLSVLLGPALRMVTVLRGRTGVSDAVGCGAGALKIVSRCVLELE